MTDERQSKPTRLNANVKPAAAPADGDSTADSLVPIQKYGKPPLAPVVGQKPEPETDPPLPSRNPPPVGPPLDPKPVPPAPPGPQEPTASEPVPSPPRAGKH